MIFIKELEVEMLKTSDGFVRALMGLKSQKSDILSLFLLYVSINIFSLDYSIFYIFILF